MLIEWKKSKYGSIINDKKIYVSHGGKCVLFQLDAYDQIEVFNPETFQAQHEVLEADTLIGYHTSKLMNHTILIRSSNSDVLVILLALHVQGCCSGNNTVILDYGAGNNRRYINISQLSEILEEMHTGLTEALLGYHAITGCDYVSCLFRKGKTTPFKRLIESTEHIQEMRTLTTNEVDVKVVTSFICSLYGYNTSHINDARYNVFIRLTIEAASRLIQET